MIEKCLNFVTMVSKKVLKEFNTIEEMAVNLVIKFHIF